MLLQSPTAFTLLNFLLRKKKARQTLVIEMKEVPFNFIGIFQALVFAVFGLFVWKTFKYTIERRLHCGANMMLWGFP